MDVRAKTSLRAGLLCLLNVVSSSLLTPPQYSSAEKRCKIDSVMKKSNRNSCDPEDDTDLEIDGIEDAAHPESELFEPAEKPGLQSQFSRGPKDDTNLEIDGIEDNVNPELETVDLLLEQGSQDRIDVVLERRTQSRDTHNAEDR